MGRKRKLTQEERREKKIKRNRKYRKDKTAEFGELVNKKEQLEKREAAHLSEINSLKEKINSLKKELSEINDRADRADNLVREVGDESKKVKMAGKALDSEMLQLEKKFLDSDDQENSAENCQFNIPRDDIYLNSSGPDLLGELDGLLDLLSGETKGTTIAKAKLPPPLPGIVNVNGFYVRKENSPMIPKIFSQYPNIASGLQVHSLALRDCFMDTLAEVYKMAIEEKHTPEEIKSMEEGIKDLELAGLEISWLKDLVKVCREVVPKGKKKKKNI